MLKNKCSVWKRIKFPTFWYNCYYFTWSDTYFIQLETLLISHPSYLYCRCIFTFAVCKNTGSHSCTTCTKCSLQLQDLTHYVYKRKSVHKIQRTLCLSLWDFTTEVVYALAFIFKSFLQQQDDGPNKNREHYLSLNKHTAV